MKIKRKDLRQAISEALKLGVGDRTEVYADPGDPEDDAMGLRFMGDKPYSLVDSPDIMDMGERVTGKEISMSNPVGGLQAAYRAISTSSPFYMKLDGENLETISRVFGLSIDGPAALEEAVHPGLILAGVGMIIILGLVAYAITQGYGVRLRGAGGVGGKKGPKGEGEIIFAPKNQEIPDTSMGQEKKAAE